MQDGPGSWRDGGALVKGHRQRSSQATGYERKKPSMFHLPSFPSLPLPHVQAVAHG